MIHVGTVCTCYVTTKGMVTPSVNVPSQKWIQTSAEYTSL